MDGYSSTYWLYKRDTDRCASWLATTAVSLGFPHKRFTAARRVSGKSASSPGLNRAKNQQYKYILRIPQFVELARFIADKHHAVPDSRLALIRRCVARRITCLKFFERDGRACTKHGHFVEVLVEVIRILQPCVQSKAEEDSDGDSAVREPQEGGGGKCRGKGKRRGKGKSKSKVKSKAKARSKGKSQVSSGAGKEDDGEIASMENFFSQLEVSSIDGGGGEEGDDADEALQYGIEDNVDEALCAFMALYADLDEIRSFLKGIWTSYRDHQTDLVTASLTTNTAFELLEKAFGDILDRYQGLFPHQCDVVLALLEYAFDLRMGRPPTYHDDEWKLILSSGDSSLHEAGMDLDGGEQSVDVEHLTDERRREIDTSLLYTAFIDFSIFDDVIRERVAGLRGAPDCSADSHDALTREMSRYARGTEGPTLLLAFELQIYLDINYVLQGHNRRARFEARDLLKQIQDGLDAAMGHTCGLDLPAPNQAYFAAAARDVDLMGIELRMRSHSVPRSPGEEPQDWSSATRIAFLDRHPTFCGLQAFRALHLYRDVGAAIARGSGITLAALHFSAACRAYLGEELKAGELDWPDIDLVVELRGPEKLFGSDTLPTDLTQSCKSLMRLYSCSDQLISDQLHGSALRMIQSLRKERGIGFVHRWDRLQNDSAFFALFAKIGRYPRDRIGGAQEQLADLRNKQLREARKRSATAISSGAATVEATTSSARGTTADRDELIQPQVARRCRPKGSFSIVELLQTLAAGLAADLPDLCFDYLTLNMGCLRVFEAIYPAISKNNESLTRADNYPYGEDPMWVVFTTLYVLEGVYSANRRRPDHLLPTLQMQKQAMLRVVAAMRGKVDEVGPDVGCRQLRATLAGLGAPASPQIEASSGSSSGSGSGSGGDGADTRRCGDDETVQAGHTS
ncbi:uncharacterized protein PFL1_06601 [Pseudozyma flocculosa PF-1]|uniref:DUF6604 domain-containing protein n=2 Tax=Pseudozyma flocculosa TaxID=84751 RepID=A0A5C3F877_9BASI|nr:uncharacterized protein PFL1_06601 [Pseudozyma flocculosa PF-1]EPQ25927.1 hypothetical protein PFL1_06601 [Pseudozyma flocculosa PF-1]SPO40572.1 uncharacterized protein PSFLO_06054 [Pseudozyma flocculosa]